NGSSYIKAFEVGHLSNFIYNSLTGYRSVSMNENGHCLLLLSLRLRFNFGSYKAFNHRIHRFKVRGVRGKLEVNLFVVDADDITGKAKVILHVTVSHGEIRFGGTFKF